MMMMMGMMTMMMVMTMMIMRMTVMRNRFPRLCQKPLRFPGPLVVFPAFCFRFPNLLSLSQEFLGVLSRPPEFFQDFQA